MRKLLFSLLQVLRYVIFLDTFYFYKMLQYIFLLCEKVVVFFVDSFMLRDIFRHVLFYKTEFSKLYTFPGTDLVTCELLAAIRRPEEERARAPEHRGTRTDNYIGSLNGQKMMKEEKKL